MQKFMIGTLLLAIIGTISTNAFSAVNLKCKFRDGSVSSVKSLQVTDESLIINSNLEIPLDESRVKCGKFGRQTRYDGRALGYQITLKSCSIEASYEGYLIDSVNNVSADVLCN